MLRVGLCGGVWVESEGRRLPEALLAGRQGRLVFAYLVCERNRSVPKEQLADLIWGDNLPSSWASSLSAVASKLRRLLGEAGLDGTEALASAFGSYRLHFPEDAWVDWEHLAGTVERAELMLSDGQAAAAVAAAKEAQDIARRGFLTDDCPWVDAQRERLRDLNIRAAHAQAKAHALAGELSRAVLAAREALALDDLREASYRLLMQSLANAGERGEALRVWERCRAMLVEELGVDPAPETEALYLAILGQTAPASPAPAPPPEAARLPSGVVTFLLTDIVDSSALWERNPSAMNIALERHDHLVGSVVEDHGGTLLKAKLEGDATVSVFPRASAAVEAAKALRDALAEEDWPDGLAPAVRMALHTGEAVERDGDYFGPAVNRAARLRALAAGGQILLSQAVAEVVRDHIPTGSALRSLGEHQLRGMSRGENVFELAPAGDGVETQVLAPPFERPRLSSVLAGRGPFVGRGNELEKLATEWASATAGTARAVLIAGEPGVGKTRLAAEWARSVYDQNAIVLYGRCDEELGAPYQPFAEALRALVPCLGAARLKSVRGIEELVRLAPELGDIASGLGEPTQADPDTERALLFDALARLLAAVSLEAPLLVVVDDLHWAAKPTLLMLRHLLRSGDNSRLLIVGTYRSTDLDRTHPLAGVLADLHRDGTVERVGLGGLDNDDVLAYLSATGYDDYRLARALSTVTSGNPFFLIEVLRHLDESGGRWDPNTLPQGIREAVSRRLSRLSEQANETLLVGAIVGSQFSLELVEQVLERELVEPIEEARHAGLVVEESGNRFRFNHALVRQSLLGEVASVRRVRLHQRVATALEADPAVSEAHLADLARHWFECAFAGGAAKAVDYSRRAGEQAMARLAYEEAADLFDRAVQAAEVEGSGCADTEQAELLLSRCEALLAAGDPTTAVSVVDKLQRSALSSPALSAWATCYSAQLAVLTHPERLDAIADEVAAAATRFAELDDPEGEAKAHTVRASCLARLGRVGDCEAALDRALTAGRRAGNPRRVNSVLGYAPLAALWGPSPIARASGRCLDVVRVLRITTGSPAVEAVALRCQAVLEALRGRTDAARRMLGSARRSLESLGHTHGLLEADLFDGMIELVAGRPAEAELSLRRAYEGFVARGVGVDAAQAAAQLARALLAQGRVDEAINLTEQSERLAGVDLQAAMAWRAARAEALAHRGSLAEALEAARAAVALADPTDALIFQADAHHALSVVLRGAGNYTEAEKESRRAVALYEQKGATARVETLRMQSAQPPPVAAAGTSAPPARQRRVRLNAATKGVEGGPVDEAHLKEWTARLADELVSVDHRFQVTLDREGVIATWTAMFSGDQPTFLIEPLATLGERHSLNRAVWQTSGGRHAVEFLRVVRVDRAGRVVRFEQFDPGELNEALARFVELYAEDELLPENSAFLRRIASQAHRGVPEWSNDAVLIDHRRVGLGTIQGRDAIRAAAIALGDVGGEIRFRNVDVLGYSEHVALVECAAEGETEAGAPFELPILWLCQFGDDGVLRQADTYSPEQADEALAHFDELVATPAVQRRVHPNLASAVQLWTAGTFRDHSVTEWEERVASDFVGVDNRFHTTEGRDAQLRLFRMWEDMDSVTFDVTVLASLGERHSLARRSYRMRGAPVGPGAAAIVSDGEIEFLQVVRVDEKGRMLRTERFELDKLHDALARLTELHADDELPVEQHDARYRIATLHRERRIQWSEDSVVVDHRPASLGVLEGRDAIRRASSALRELSNDVRWRFVEVLGFTESVTLLETVSEGQSADGGIFEIPVLTVNTYNDNGFLRRSEWYSPEQLDEALARFDELTVTPTDLERRVRPNLASEAMPAGPLDHESVGRWAAQLRDDFMAVDHTMQLTLDRSGMVETWRQMAREPGRAFVRRTMLASLGQRHALHLFTWTAGDDPTATVEVRRLNAIRTDSDGLVSRVEHFGPDQLNAALARLVELHAEDEVPDERLEERQSVAAAFRQTQTLWSDDAVVVDHRRASLGTLSGREEIAAAATALRGVGVDQRRRFADVIGLTERASLFEMLTEGLVDGGGPFELSVFAVSEVNTSGLCCRQEWFGPDQRADALARFDELTAAAPAAFPDFLGNSAARQLQSFEEFFKARDWAGMGSLFSSASVVEDRRAIVGGTRTEGREAIVQFWQASAEVGTQEQRFRVIATRGDRLCLSYGLAVFDESEIAYLVVSGTDEQGRQQLGIGLDPDDLDAAYDELDARYSLGDGADSTTWAIWKEMEVAHLERDWARFRAIHTPDFVFVDRRHSGSGTLNLEEYVGARQAMVQLAPDTRLRTIAIHEVGPKGTIHLISLTGTNDTGGDYELQMLALGVFAGSRASRIEFFETDALEDARRRLDELTSVENPVAPYLHSEATRLDCRIWDWILARNWDAVWAMTADDAVVDDRRSIIGSQHAGRDAAVAVLKSLTSIGVTQHDATVLATRGDHLFIADCLFRGEQGEAEALCLLEYRNGQWRGVTLFDPDQLDEAFNELDSKYAEEHPAAWLPGFEFINAHNQRDWDAFASYVADDYAYVDHRQAGFGVLNADGHMRFAQALVDLAPDARWRVLAVPRISDYGSVSVIYLSGTNSEGGPFETPLLGIGIVGGSKLSRVEIWPIEDLPGALERFEELAGDQESGGRAAPIDLANDAFRAWRRHIDFFEARDWDNVVANLGKAVVAQDRRRIVGGLIHTGRIEYANTWRSVAAIGVTAVDSTPLATRGDRLVLHRTMLRGATGESEVLFVMESDEDGLHLGGVSFDPDDIDAAYEELDVRYASLEAAQFSNEWAVMVAGVNAYNSRDWRAVRDLGTDDFTFVDRRPAGWGELGDNLVGTLQGLLELAPDHCGRIAAVLRITNGAALSLESTSGTDEEGGAFAMDHLAVWSFEGRRGRRLEWFRIEDLDDAVSRYEELASESHVAIRFGEHPLAAPSGPQLYNIAAGVIDALADHAVAGEWQAYGEGISENAVLDDRRRLVQLRAVGRDEVVRFSRSAIEVGVREVIRTVIAIRGERLVLTRDVYRGPDAESEVLRVSEVASDGSWFGGVLFDPDDLDAAFDELNSRFARGEPLELIDPWKLTMTALSSFTRRDWTGFTACFDDDYVFIDHRPLGIGRLAEAGTQAEYDRSTLVHLFQDLVDLAPDVRVRMTEVVRLTDAGIVYRQLITGTTVTGVHFENPSIIVGTFRLGHGLRNEAFDEAEQDAALARFEELIEGANHRHTGLLENQVTRLIADWVDLILADDWTGVFETLAPNAVGDDRRPVIGRHVVGRDALLQEYQSLRGVGVTDIQVTPIATRGERLALTRQRYAGSSGESVVLSVAEVSPEGKSFGYSLFEEGDMDTAFDKLDTLYGGGETSTNAAAWSMLCAWCAGVNRRDWDACRAVLADDCLLLDHRPIGLPDIAGDEIVRMMEESVNLSPDSRLRVGAVLSSADWGIAWYQQFLGTTDMDGGDWEKDGLFVARVHGSQMHQIEAFPTRETEAALACLERFSEEVSTNQRDQVADEDAERTAEAASRHLDAALLAHDWQQLGSLLDPNIVRIDRRAGLRLEYNGRDQAVAENRVIGEGIQDISVTTVASRGEQLLLQHKRATGSPGSAGPTDFEILFLIEVGDDGAITHVIWFDPTDLASALDELDRRYVPGLAPREAEVWSASVAFGTAYNARDESALVAALTEDCVIVDERMTGWGILEAKGFIRNLGQMIELAPDVHLSCVAVHHLSEDGSVARFRISGTIPGGGEFELLFEGTSVVRDSKLCRLELLPEGQVEEAERRLERRGFR